MFLFFCRFVGDLRPNKNYIDGAILVYDVARYKSKIKIKELLLDEYSSYINNKIPIMIVATECKNKIREDLLEDKNFFGEEFLFNAISIKEKTSINIDKILKEIKDLNELTSPSNQFKLMMEHATQLYLCEIPNPINDMQRQVETSVLRDGIKGIKSFLSLVCI
ncbi:5359_t:CDS:2 [Dentiscutata erythropus]|uniref:5359_t:CDS:1 n=1 Tax=Dentiscutata erythropus TaxID=1348616 RepID=A0A9N9FA61_9GLOM|nr:5359_t:CDS:2 [Dentiscutata erythropus]